MTRFTLGEGGPVTVTPGEVADLVEPMVRTWIAQCRTNGASPEAVAVLEEWHRSLRSTAVAYRRSITDVGTDVGELPDARRRSTDPDVVQGLPVSVAAERLHLNPRTVTGLIGRGLTGRQVGGVWLVDPASVDAYAALRASA